MTRLERDAGRLLALVGIVLFAFSLRSGVGSLSPIVDEISQDVPLSSWMLGLIGTAPPVSYAVFGIVTPWLERRFGLLVLAVVALAAASLGLVGRALAPDAWLLLAMTIVLFAGIGIGNVVLPPLIKRYFPDRIGFMTMLYTTTMSLSTFVPPLISVPIADAVSWRASLGLWAIFAVVALIPWVLLILRERVPASGEALTRAPSARAVSRVWRMPMAWALIGGFIVTSGTAYASFAWLPTILIDLAGVTPATAGVLLSVMAAIGLPAALFLPTLVSRVPVSVGPLFYVAGASGLGGVTGLLWAPGAAPLLWVTLLGAATLLFPLVLMLINLRARTPEGTVALSGVVQGVGYAIAALFPFGLGLLHEATGGWIIPLGLLALLMLVAFPAGVIASRRETVEQQWERRHGAW